MRWPGTPPEVKPIPMEIWDTCTISFAIGVYVASQDGEAEDRNEIEALIRKFDQNRLEPNLTEEDLCISIAALETAVRIATERGDLECTARMPELIGRLKKVQEKEW